MDFAPALPADAALASATAKAMDEDSGADATLEVLDSPQCDVRGSTATCLVKGGLPGHAYAVSVLANLTTGERVEESFILKIDGGKSDSPSPSISAAATASLAASGLRQGDAVAKVEASEISRTPETGDRKPSGRFTYLGSGVPASTRRADAYGRGEGDRRRIVLRAVGIPADHPPVWPADVDESTAEKKTVPVSKLVLTRPTAVRGRLGRAAKTFKAGLKNEGDGISPILVTPHEDGSDRYAVVRGRGEHRVAAAALEDPKAEVPVLVAPRRTEKAFDPNQPRDEGGRFSEGGTARGKKPKESKKPKEPKELEIKAWDGKETLVPGHLVMLEGDDEHDHVVLESQDERGDIPRVLVQTLGTGFTIAPTTRVARNFIKPKLAKQLSTSVFGAGAELAPRGYGRLKTRDRRLGADAKRQAASGKNPPSWVADEVIWEKAKTAAKKTYDEDDAAFWPVVTTIYRKMGGEVRSTAKKQEDDVSDAAKNKIEMRKREMGLSSSELRNKISAAVKAKFGMYAWVIEVFPDTQYVVVDKGGYGYPDSGEGRKLCRIEYEIGDDDAIELGEPEIVELDYVPLKKEKEVEVEAAWDEKTEKHVVSCASPEEATALAKALAETGSATAVEIPDGESAFSFRLTDGSAAGKSARVFAVAEYEEWGAPGSDLSEVVKSLEILDDDDEIRKAAEEKGLLTMLAYPANRKDKQNEWTDEDELEKAAHGFLAEHRRINLFHRDDDPSEVVESWIARNDWKVGTRTVKKGDWLMTVRLSEKAKKLYKEGKIRGASIEGSAVRVPA